VLPSAPCHEELWGSRGIFPSILNLDPRWRLVVKLFTHRPFYHIRGTPGANWVGGWLVPEPVWTLWRTEKHVSAENRTPIPLSSSPQPSHYTASAIPHKSVTGTVKFNVESRRIFHTSETDHPVACSRCWCLLTRWPCSCTVKWMADHPLHYKDENGHPYAS
jgi:hypothetical protein